MTTNRQIQELFQDLELPSDEEVARETTNVKKGQANHYKKNNPNFRARMREVVENRSDEHWHNLKTSAKNWSGEHRNNHRQSQIARGETCRAEKNGKFKGDYIATNIVTGEELRIRGSTGLRDHPLGPFNRGRVTECCQNPDSVHKGYTWRREPLDKSK